MVSKLWRDKRLVMITTTAGAGAKIIMISVPAMSTKIDVHEPPVASKYKPCVWDSSLDSQDVACLEWFREYLCENTVTALHNYAGSVLMLQQRAKRMGLDCEVFTVRDPPPVYHSTWCCLTACVPVPGICRQPVRAHDMARQRPIEAWPPPQQSHGACHSCTEHVRMCCHMGVALATGCGSCRGSGVVRGSIRRCGERWPCVWARYAGHEVCWCSILGGRGALNTVCLDGALHSTQLCRPFAPV